MDTSAEDTICRWTKMAIIWIASTATCIVALSWLIAVELSIIMTLLMKYADADIENKKGWAQLGFMAILFVSLTLPLPIFCTVWQMSGTLYAQNRLGESVALLFLTLSPSILVRAPFVLLRYGLIVAVPCLAWWVVKGLVKIYKGENGQQTYYDTKDYRFDPEESFDDPNSRIELEPLMVVAS